MDEFTSIFINTRLIPIYFPIGSTIAYYKDGLYKEKEYDKLLREIFSLTPIRKKFILTNSIKNSIPAV